MDNDSGTEHRGSHTVPNVSFAFARPLLHRPTGAGLLCPTVAELNSFMVRKCR